MIEKVIRFTRNNLFLIFLFLLSLFLRTWWLDLFPPSMVHDELNYVMNAKSLFYTGKNIPLTASSAFSWGEKNWDVVISEIPSVLLAPWTGILKLNQFNARVPFAVVGSFSVLFLFLIAKHLLGERIAKFSGIIFALNPWSIHFSRISLEVTFASFFFLAGTYLFLTKDSWRVFLAFPFFLGGFMSYLGAKLHFLPVVAILATYKFLGTKSKNKKKTYIIFVLFAVACLAVYTITMKYQPAGERRGELILFNNHWASEVVNSERRQAIPNPALTVFSNKATVPLKRIADVYISGFSASPLFARGDVVSVYSLWQHGQFYYLDFFLILLGLAVLFSLKRKVFWLVVAIIILGPTVSSIDLVEETYSVRAYPMFPYLSLLSGIGLWFIKENFGKLAFFVAAFLYVALVLNFLHLYFYRYPIYSAERWFFSERLIARYASLLQENNSVREIRVVVRENPKNVYEQYLFYSGKYDTKEDVRQANNNLLDKIFSDGKVIFTQDCPKELNLANDAILIADARSECAQENRGDAGFVSLADAGTVFVIKNDKLCDKFSLPRYYLPASFEPFRVENLEAEEFCKNWVVRF